jgi:hypothetical protein
VTGMLAIGWSYPYRLDLRQRLVLAGLENINLAQSRAWNPHLLHERVSNTASSLGRGPSARTGRRKAALQRGVCERLLIMANSHEAVTRVTMQRTGGQWCVHARQLQCFGARLGCHDQFLGCMGKFSCAVTMVGDAFQEQSGQYRERLRLSGPRLGTAAIHGSCVTLTTNARSPAELRRMCV